MAITRAGTTIKKIADAAEKEGQRLIGPHGAEAPPMVRIDIEPVKKTPMKMPEGHGGGLA